MQTQDKTIIPTLQVKIPRKEIAETPRKEVEDKKITQKRIPTTITSDHNLLRTTGT